jgi:hypothetical protein
MGIIIRQDLFRQVDFFIGRVLPAGRRIQVGGGKCGFSFEGFDGSILQKKGDADRYDREKTLYLSFKDLGRERERISPDGG